ncbi:unnamed protein product [Heligmosomoides polygyrus]|uniref:Cytochrome P450 n=1 Tax=Heligmosomoides polygyrus TaxID=6339 RepID=A0A183GNW3_HELPZ|nr:unnamed protein product [Heligmosomoides polygyrus]
MGTQSRVIRGSNYNVYTSLAPFTPGVSATNRPYFINPLLSGTPGVLICITFIASFLIQFCVCIYRSIRIVFSKAAFPHLPSIFANFAGLILPNRTVPEKKTNETGKNIFMFPWICSEFLETMHFVGACSAIGRGACCRVYLIPFSRFEFSVRANQALHPSDVEELVEWAPYLSGRDKTAEFFIGWPPQGMCTAKHAFKLPPRYHIKTECVALPKRD